MCNVLPLWLCSAHGCALSVTFLLKVSYFIKKRKQERLVGGWGMSSETTLSFPSHA